MVKDAKLKPDAVKTMLKYVYSDFRDVADIDSASVWDVLYAGNQFCVVAVAIVCLLSTPDEPTIFSLIKCY